MKKQAFKVIQPIHHDGKFYSPFIFPYENSVIFAYPHEVHQACQIGALIHDPNIPVPEELGEDVPPPTPPKSLTPMLKPLK